MDGPICMLLLQTLPKYCHFVVSALLALLLVGLGRPAWPSEPPPRAVFVQHGWAEHADSISLGGGWRLGWRYERPCCTFTSSIEATISRWSFRTDSSEHVTQYGLTPAIRMERPGPNPRWFLEVGIGAAIISPIYRNRDRHFSTAFNFAEYLGIGRAFGERRDHELILRVEHFSNAGIKRPNPGENFIQIRYQKRF